MAASVTAAYKNYASPIVFSQYTSGRETAKFLLAINDSSSKCPNVIHLHGFYNIPESIILSAAHYEKKYGIKILKPPTTKEHSTIQDQSWPFLRKIMWALMATRRILYVGFSMTDDYFKIMHEIVSEDARQGGIGMHWMLQRIPPREDEEMDDEYEKRLAEVQELAKFFSSKYGIESVFFIDDKTYNGLPNLIEEIREKVEMLLGDESSVGQIDVPLDSPTEGTPAGTTDYKTLLELARLNANNND
jgi:hypothetical protein